MRLIQADLVKLSILQSDLLRTRSFRFNMTEERRNWRPKHGLAALSETLLGISMDKSLDLRAGDWNSKVLSPEQKKYAALDAWTALKIAHCLASPNLNPNLMKISEIEQKLTGICRPVMDRPFNDRVDYSELMHAIYKDHPDLKIKEYLPGIILNMNRLSLC